MRCTDTILRYGSRGLCVEWLQRALHALGFDPGPIDGIFGPRTEAAVIEFQRTMGIQVDGIVGPQTWAALVNALLQDENLRELLCELEEFECATEPEGATTTQEEEVGTTTTEATIVSTTTTSAGAPAEQVTARPEPEAVIHVPIEVYNFIATIGAAPFYKSPFNKLGELMTRVYEVAQSGDKLIIRGPKSVINEIKRLVDEAWKIANKNVVYVDRKAWEYLAQFEPEKYWYYEYYTLLLSDADPNYVVVGTIPEVKRQLEQEIKRILSGIDARRAAEEGLERTKSETTKGKTETTTRKTGGYYYYYVDRKQDDTLTWLMLAGGAILLLAALAGSGRKKDKELVVIGGTTALRRIVV